MFFCLKRMSKFNETKPVIRLLHSITLLIVKKAVAESPWRCRPDSTVLALRCLRCCLDSDAFMNFLLRCYYVSLRVHGDSATLLLLLLCCFTSTVTSKVMSRRSVNITTLFLGRLRLPKRLTSTSCTYFRQ